MDAMHQAAMHQLAAVPGVVGGMVFDPAGGVAGSAFPAVFDPAGLQQLAGQLAGDGYFQGWLTGENASLDLRFGDGRVVIRALGGQWLLVLCTPQANPQLLSMSMTQVTRRLRAAGDGNAVVPGKLVTPTPAQPSRAAPSVLDRLRALATAELGSHAGQALEILATAGPGPKGLSAAIADIEKMTRLFISKKMAEEIGRRMRDVLSGST